MEKKRSVPIPKRSAMTTGKPACRSLRGPVERHAPDAGERCNIPHPLPTLDELPRLCDLGAESLGIPAELYPSPPSGLDGGARALGGK